MCEFGLSSVWGPSRDFTLLPFDAKISYRQFSVQSFFFFFPHWLVTLCGPSFILEGTPIRPLPLGGRGNPCLLCPADGFDAHPQSFTCSPYSSLCLTLFDPSVFLTDLPVLWCILKAVSQVLFSLCRCLLWDLAWVPAVPCLQKIKMFLSLNFVFHLETDLNEDLVMST